MPSQAAEVTGDDLATAERRLATPEAQDGIVLRVPQLEVVVVELVVSWNDLVFTNACQPRAQNYHRI